MASTYIQRTFSGAGNRKTWTMSMWMKRTVNVPSGTDRVWGWKSGGGNYGFQFDNDQLRFYLCSGGSGAEFLTNRHFRDTNAWYHIVAKCDTTQSTASDRVKIYIDGDQITSFSTESYPTQNYDGNVSTAVQHNVGAQTGNNRQCDGYLAEVNYVDGTALTPSTFGLTDTSTGRWIPKTLTGFSYGTNGFRLQHGTNSNLGDDIS